MATQQEQPWMVCPSPPKPGAYPFWFWNGRQEEHELLRQLRLFKRNGCRGAVIHSRAGNRIPYLGKVWFDHFEAVCAEARRLGMKIWIYDEDGFPSGNVGKRLPRKYPHLVQKVLCPQIGEANPDTPAYAAYLPDEPETSVDETTVPPGTRLLRFVLMEHPIHVDVLHPETCQRFLAMTHRKYERLQGYFGDVIQAVYTDDLAFQLFHVPGYVFSPALEEECRRLGHPLKSLLGHLAMDTQKSAEARTLFYRTAQRLFLENFVRPQLAWCHRFGLNYLGHLCGDEGPLAQSIRNFASAQPFLQLEDIPSVDDFFTEICDQRYLAHSLAPHEIAIHDGQRKCKNTIPLLTFKLASTIAHCFSGQNFSSETLAYLGWNCTPDFIQAQMLFELAQGVTLFTHHAYYYTVAGVGKRDCPPSWSYQQPMFGIFGRMNRMWTRLAKLLRRGKDCADVLLVFPTSLLSLPGFADISRKMLTNDLDSPVNRAETALAKLLLELTRRHICFDILDETILSQHAIISRNGAVRVGAMKYHTVIRPDVLPLTETSEILLAKQASLGGRIVYATDASRLLSPDLMLSGEGNEEILVVKRKVKTHREYLLLNLSGRDLQPGIKLPSEDAEALIYDPMAEKRIVCQPNSLKSLLLRKGAILMLMSPDFSAETQDMASSQYAEYCHSTSLSPCSITFDGENLRRIQPKDGRAIVTLEAGAAVTAILTESTDISRIRINGRRISSSPRPSTFDCNILEMSCKGLFRHGENTILVHTEEPIFLKGDFYTEGEELILHRPEIANRHGNLAEMGYPNYCGKVTYTYQFRGRYAQLEVDSANASLVRINGKEAGVIFGNPHFLGIERLCHNDDNLLEIELCNQFGNFIDRASPYGINGVTLWLS